MFRSLRDLAESFDTAFATSEDQQYATRVVDIDGLGPVKLGRPFAEGGFSIIHRAEPLSGPPNRPIAVKRISTTDEDGMLRAKAEADILANLPSHENIVTYFGAAFVGADAFLAFELVDGGSLPDYLDRRRQRGPIPADHALSIFSDICAAVVVLHSQEPPIACRDLKLENVLYDAGERRFKLCDFGSCTTVAKRYTSRRDILAAEDEISEHSSAMYRAPEMCDLHAKPFICERVDVWSLGCVFYAILFGDLPFDGQSTIPIMEGRLNIPTSPAYPTSFIKLLKAMITVSPEKRVDSFTVMEAVSRLRGVDMDSSLREKGEALRLRRRSEMDGGETSRGDAPSKIGQATRNTSSLATNSASPPHISRSERQPSNTMPSTPTDFFEGAFGDSCRSGESHSPGVVAFARPSTPPSQAQAACPVAAAEGDVDDDDDWGAFESAPTVKAQGHQVLGSGKSPLAEEMSSVNSRNKEPCSAMFETKSLESFAPSPSAKFGTSPVVSLAASSSAARGTPRVPEPSSGLFMQARPRPVVNFDDLIEEAQVPTSGASGGSQTKSTVHDNVSVNHSKGSEQDLAEMFSDLLPTGFGNLEPR